MQDNIRNTLPACPLCGAITQSDSAIDGKFIVIAYECTPCNMRFIERVDREDKQTWN